MDKISCEVIRDLLPLYEDDAASEETQDLVRKHLAECPDCREELRKMRVPISMPPDEDEEAVRRFLARRAEIRRKQNVKIACVASVLAVIVTFILCYTLIPRSWDSVAGMAGAVAPDRIMGSHVLFTFYEGSPGIDVWRLDDEQERDAKVIEAVMDTLRAGTYRAELRNVLSCTPLGESLRPSVEGLQGSIDLYLVKDRQVTLTVSLYDTDDHIVQIQARAGGTPNTFFYRADSGLLYNALAALIQEYGSLQ